MVIFSAMLNSSNKFMPGRLFLPGCAIAAGVLSVSPHVFAQAPTQSGAKKSVQNKPFAAPIQLRIGSTVSFPLAANAKFIIEEGAVNIAADTRNEALALKGVMSGSVRVRIQTPNKADAVYTLSVYEKSKLNANLLVNEKAVTTQENSEQFITRRASLQVSERSALLPPDSGDSALPDYLLNIPAPTIPVSPSPAQPPASSDLPDLVPTDNAVPIPMPTLPAPPVAAPMSQVPELQVPEVPEPLPLVPAPTPTPVVKVQPTPKPIAVPTPVAVKPAPQVVRPTAPKISQILPAPAKNVKPAGVTYKTQPSIPSTMKAGPSGQTIQVTQGLARVISFPDNILAVFFSDPAVMDARAINARTIAVTGIGGGQSTLAVFTSRYEGDAVGKANVYRLQTVPRGAAVLADNRTPESVAEAITMALGDPRIRVSATKVPNGPLVARLSGTVRNAAEVEAASATAKFFAPEVVSALYADINAPSIDAVYAGSVNLSPEAGLQSNLRRITGNPSIELVPLPTGIAFKAEVESQDEAESLLRLLPSLNQQVIPFIVVRGQSASDERYYNSTVPLLIGEDLQLTQKLQSVTGIRTVYAVRSSGNSVSIYGNVRNRSEYEAVSRYAYVIAQKSDPVASQGATQGGSVLRPQGFEGPNIPSYDPVAGYFKQLGVQLFVRIVDPSEATVRNITVETNIVEISRTSLKNLGAEYGSSQLTREIIIPGTPANGDNPAVPGRLEREINPAFNAGSILSGNGFLGTGGFGSIDPFRVQVNALAQKGDARILASPNLRAVEGSTAQITIGGERPVPKAVAANGTTGQSVEFRRYGVIVTMRPTVTDDNTIILQIRCDITQPDRTYEINLGGALIPGESVRSVDTTMTMRAGDTVVLGGLLTNDKRQRTSKVPILGDLPILGPLFKSKRYENNETELAIFLTPRIDALNATMDTQVKVRSAPGFPQLPSRQETNDILVQGGTNGG
jgi:Flp pilus assembly secretin CpaC